MKRLMQVLLLAYLSACGGMRPVVFEPTGEKLSVAETASLVQQAKDRDSQIKGVRALATVRLNRGAEEFTFRNVIVFERPEKLRLETLAGNSAQPLNILVINPDGYRFVDYVKKESHDGSDARAVIEQIFGINLNTSEILNILVGVPLALRAQTFSCYQDRLGLIISCLNTDPKIYLEFIASEGSLSFLQIGEGAAGYLRLEARYAEYTTVNGVRVPLWLKLLAPQAGIEIELNYSYFKLAETNLSEALFNFEF